MAPTPTSLTLTLTEQEAKIIRESLADELGHPSEGDRGGGQPGVGGYDQRERRVSGRRVEGPPTSDDHRHPRAPRVGGLMASLATILNVVCGFVLPVGAVLALSDGSPVAILALVDVGVACFAAGFVLR